jgi:deazaflavin-dependent oxidoreductase (nitroreductase family)
MEEENDMTTTRNVEPVGRNEPDQTAVPSPQARYVEPGWFTRRVFNPAVALATRLGLSLQGSRVLAVRGRTTGEIRTVPVNLLHHDGGRYLVAPRGETQWVRNLRAAGGSASLRVGRKEEAISTAEIADEDKVPVLRAYLDRWGWEVGQFFEGVDKNASDAQLAAIAPDFPVFRLG